MIELPEVYSTILRIAFLETLLEGCSNESEEKERLMAALSKTYGHVGERLAQKLLKDGNLRVGVSRAMINGFILRRHEVVEDAMFTLLDLERADSKTSLCPCKVRQFIARILSEEGVQKKEATLIAVMPKGMLPKKQALESMREGLNEKKPKPLRLRVTRTQSQIDTALAGSVWEGAIIASSAEFIPPGFIRLVVLLAKGVKRHNLSNSIENILKKAGIEQIYIVKGYYREDLLKACTGALREPARSRLLEAIESESIALLSEA